MSTAVATWGNSAAVRIPREKLRVAGLKNGDAVEIEVNSSGHLEIIPVALAHRRITVSNRLSFSELFKDYDNGRFDNSAAWPTDTLVGAEIQVWNTEEL